MPCMEFKFPTTSLGYYFGSHLKVLLITFFAKLMTHSRVWE